MKIIKPLEIDVRKFTDYEKYLTTVEESFKYLVNVKDENIQCVKSELNGDILKCKMHPFVEAVHVAYSQHLPLIITPDMIWYLISSATAIHINKNAESFRNKFVDHEDKKRIVIIRDDFVFKSQRNPWHELIDDFSSAIKEMTKNEIADTFIANFSTTTKDSRVVSQIVLMDAMQKYFEYYCLTRCGIPEIRIHGDKKDWENLKSKTLKIIEMIPEFEKWYNNGLSEILNQFIDVFDDEIDNSFWSEIYKFSGGSGGPYVNGWIVTLFPYLDKESPNIFVWEKSWRQSKGHFSGVKTVSFKYHMNQLPFIWNYLGTEIDMLFIGGLIGVLLHKDQALQAVFGYGITENKIIYESKSSD